MRQQKKNAGFTLVELVVSLSVGLIICAMLLIMLSSVNNVFEAKNAQMERVNEFECFKTEIFELNEQYLLRDNLLEINENANGIIIEKDSEMFELTFNDNELFFSNQSIKNFKTIKKCEISQIENILVFNLEFDNKSERKFVI